MAQSSYERPTQSDVTRAAARKRRAASALRRAAPERRRQSALPGRLLAVLLIAGGSVLVNACSKSSSGEHGEIKTLASGIIEAQQREIEQMKSWRAEWYPEE